MKIGEWVLYKGKRCQVMKLLAGRAIIRPVYSTVRGEWQTVARCEVIPIEERVQGLKFNGIEEVDIPLNPPSKGE